ncbi:sec-independent translocase [Streptomyces vinaceus]|uniref:sec-independent translocase n=1 Tax=Streptomyces vinaceus TaxID=1960 RepID=UPI0036CD0FD2
MFNDGGILQLATIMVLAILIFGPDKLPKVIQDVSGVIRMIRSLANSAKQDVRSELGLEFKDFEFEDLNPKTFIRKQLTENTGLKEIRSSFDLHKELNDTTTTVNSKKGEWAPATMPAATRTPFDADAT